MPQGFGAPTPAKTVSSQRPPALLATETLPQPWFDHFANLEDPRGQQGVEHPLLSIAMIAILAVIGGAIG